MATPGGGSLVSRPTNGLGRRLGDGGSSVVGTELPGNSFANDFIVPVSK